MADPMLKLGIFVKLEKSHNIPGEDKKRKVFNTPLNDSNDFNCQFFCFWLSTAKLRF